LYSTCIFCHSNLGKNEAVEHFPVGRRLAFDGAKGRLWVVCAKCGRWNLTPLEERWEAVEECERQYRATITRASTDEIGLGRVRDGTDLIRVGKPLRPEFAAWRYGRTFQKRFREKIIGGSAVVAGTGALVLAGVPFNAAVLPMYMIGAFGLFARASTIRAQSYMLERVSKANGRNVNQVMVRVIPHDDEQGWALRFSGFDTPVDIVGRDALHMAHIIMPVFNPFGGRPSVVGKAVEEIEQVGSPDKYFRHIVTFMREKREGFMSIGQLPAPMRLAAEMSAHEETERVAMEGELKQLENDWREAEEVAAIADNLFLPKSVTDFIDRHRPYNKD
jgi:hypothetical protein